MSNYNKLYKVQLISIEPKDGKVQELTAYLSFDKISAIEPKKERLVSDDHPFGTQTDYLEITSTDDRFVKVKGTLDEFLDLLKNPTIEF